MNIWRRKPLKKKNSLQIEFIEKESKNLGSIEKSLNQVGFHYILGIDEAGRGSAAGPVVACACMLQPSLIIKDLNDSKKLSARQREKLFEEITKNAICYGISKANADEIDKINILKATFKAMKKAAENALKSSKIDPEIVIIDGNLIIPDFFPFIQKAIVKGDQKSYNIAAASILAKVTRDKIMEEYDTLYTEYGFKEHKGYVTKKHVSAIKKYGWCPIHRKTFKIKNLEG